MREQADTGHRPRGAAAVSRPYETLLAKGEDRRQHILEVALRMLAGGGSRSTTLGQVARAAGMSTAGLLHHFQSKEQLLRAVLDARDAQDEAAADLEADLESQLRGLRRRFERSPELVGMFIVLLCENIDPQAPLHDRFLGRYRSGVGRIAAAIRRGQRAGRFRAEVDPSVKAREVIAFLYGIEAIWLLDPAVQAVRVVSDYTRALIAQLTLKEAPLCSRCAGSPWSPSSSGGRPGGARHRQRPGVAAAGPRRPAPIRPGRRGDRQASGGRHWVTSFSFLRTRVTISL
jgi:AcrR family transcriptional regulator